MTPRVIAVKSKMISRGRNKSRYEKFENNNEGSVTPDNFNFKHYAVTQANRSYIKHAIADLGDNSNDYSEDMDESVAFSKGFSDKENCEMQRKIIAKTTKNSHNTFKSTDEDLNIINSKASVVWNKKHVRSDASLKRNKKIVKTNRQDLANKMAPLNYTTGVKPKQKGFQVQHPDKRRTSHAT